MSIKDFFRAGEVEKLDAIGDVNWLKEIGFWSMVQKAIDKKTNDIHQRLSNPVSTHEADLLLKGELRGIKQALIEIDKVKNNVQRNRGGQ